MPSITKVGPHVSELVTQELLQHGAVVDPVLTSLGGGHLRQHKSVGKKFSINF